jgi:hypothetical protein
VAVGKHRRIRMVRSPQLKHAVVKKYAHDWYYDDLPMNLPQPPSREILTSPRAYVRVDGRVVATLPELGEAVRSF